MKQHAVLLMATLLVLCHACFGKELKPDRTISITSIEHREGNTGKPYKVEGRTSGSQPTFYYKLACGTGAADLEVGHAYRATEATIEGTKTLLIWNINPEAKTNVFGIGCDVESVKTSDDSKH
jgi:hypothetical protein